MTNAYGPCFEKDYVMSLPEGKGALAEAIKFASE
jgi:hypothetical protein